jgi:hypothetical protein
MYDVHLKNTVCCPLISLESLNALSGFAISVLGCTVPTNIIVSTTTDTTPNSLKMLATQEQGSAAQGASGFSLDTANNVTALPDSQLLVYVSDSSDGVVGEGNNNLWPNTKHHIVLET